MRAQRGSDDRSPGGGTRPWSEPSPGAGRPRPAGRRRDARDGRGGAGAAATTTGGWSGRRPTAAGWASACVEAGGVRGSTAGSRSARSRSRSSSRSSASPSTEPAARTAFHVRRLRRRPRSGPARAPVQHPHGVGAGPPGRTASSRERRGPTRPRSRRGSPRSSADLGQHLVQRGRRARACRPRPRRPRCRPGARDRRERGGRELVQVGVRPAHGRLEDPVHRSGGRAELSQLEAPPDLAARCRRAEARTTYVAGRARRGARPVAVGFSPGRCRTTGSRCRRA